MGVDDALGDCDVVASLGSEGEFEDLFGGKPAEGEIGFVFDIVQYLNMSIREEGVFVYVFIVIRING